VGASSTTLAVSHTSTASAAGATERQTAGGGQQQCEAKENVFIYLSRRFPKENWKLAGLKRIGKTLIIPWTGG